MKTVALGPNRVTFIARGSETAGRYSLVEWDMAAPPAPGPPLHAHLAEEEAVYVLAGELNVTVGERTTRLGPGGYAHVPRGARHTLANPGPERARFLVVLSPPGYEAIWEEIGDYAEANGRSPDPETILALQLKYHMDAGGVARRF